MFPELTIQKIHWSISFIKFAILFKDQKNVRVNMAKRIKIKDLLMNPKIHEETNVKGWVRTKRGNRNVVFISINDGSTMHNIQAVQPEKSKIIHRR